MLEVHRELGPGLLESAYQACLAYELKAAKIPFESEVPLPVRYKGLALDCAYRMDFVIEKSLVLELKAVDSILPSMKPSFSPICGFRALKSACWSISIPRCSGKD